MLTKERYGTKGQITLTVIIVSYFHERTIQACLDSILLSSTQNVELIISDDASKDKTTEIEKQWLLKNGDKFMRTVLRCSPYNEGTVSNIVQAIDLSTSGYIIKCLSGDDFFLPKALDKIREYSCVHNYDVAFSPMKIAKDGVDEESVLSPTRIKNFFQLSFQDQYKSQLYKNNLYAPGAFFTRQFWEKIDLKSQQLKLVEDWYMWLKGLAMEQCYCHYPDPLVVYRKNNSSVSKDSYSANFKIYLHDLYVTHGLTYSLRPDWLNFSDKVTISLIRAILFIIMNLPSSILGKIDTFRRKFFNPTG